jgi:hypothetical protein
MREVEERKAEILAKQGILISKKGKEKSIVKRISNWKFPVVKWLPLWELKYILSEFKYTFFRMKYIK